MGLRHLICTTLKKTVNYEIHTMQNESFISYLKAGVKAQPVGLVVNAVQM